MSIARILIGAAVGAVVGYAGYKTYQHFTKEEESKTLLKEVHKNNGAILSEQTEESVYFDFVHKSLPALKFNKNWAGTTGYFEKIAQDQTIPIGRWATESDDGRKIIVIRSDDGHAVINYRYSDDARIVAMAYGDMFGSFDEGVQSYKSLIKIFK